MIRLSVAALQLLELFVSSLVHIAYGFYIFSTAVAGDLSQALNEWIYSNPGSNVKVVSNFDSKILSSADDLPPIVLLHGIFGFGKGVCVNFPSIYMLREKRLCFSKVILQK